jgi:prefoldin subunit 5
MVALMAKGIQELNDQNKDLEQKISELEKRIENLEKEE